MENEVMEFMPPELKEYYKKVLKLEYDQKPDYESLRIILENEVKSVYHSHKLQMNMNGSVPAIENTSLILSLRQ